MKRLISLLLVLVLTFALVGTASADGDTPAFVVSEATAAPGETAEVTVSLANNTGVASVELNLQYDHDVLELTAITDNTTAYPGLWTNKVEDDVFTFWAEGGSNNTQNDVLVTLTFAVNENAAAGEYPVTVTYDEDNVYDTDEVNVYFDVREGKVTVTGSETADTPTFVVSEATAAPGETAEVTVSLANNTGVASVELNLQYDHDVLELTAITDNTTAYPGLWTNKVEDDVFTFWAEGGSNNTQNDVLVTLTFAVNENAAAGEYPVTVTYDEDNVYDTDEVNVHFDVQPGKVTVEAPETIEDGYYLIGLNGWTVDTLTAADKFAENEGATGEYMIEKELAVGDEFKAVKVENGVIADSAWYPGGWDNNYVVDADHSGNVTIYFRPDYSGGSDWYYNCLYIRVKPAFMTQSLLLEGDIGVRFYVRLPGDLRNENTNVSFTISGKNGDKYASTVPYSEDLKTNSKGHVGFTFYVNTVQMADTITATLNCSDGETLEKTYTVKEYFAAFDEAYEAHPELYADEVVALIEATADLGHYVQVYLQDRGGWSIGTDHAEMDVVYEENIANFLDEATAAVADHAITATGSNSDIKKLNYTVNFESKMSIHMIVQMKSGFSGTLTATTEDGVECNITQQTATKFLVEIPNVQAHQLSHIFTINLTTDNGTLTLKGSGLSYAQMMLAGANGNTVTQNAMTAFYRYSDAADEVKGNPGEANKINGSSNN